MPKYVKKYRTAAQRRKAWVQAARARDILYRNKRIPKKLVTHKKRPGRYDWPAIDLGSYIWGDYKVLKTTNKGYERRQSASGAIYYAKTPAYGKMGKNYPRVGYGRGGASGAPKIMDLGISTPKPKKKGTKRVKGESMKEAYQVVTRARR